jgi:hypothetical protein
VERIGEELGRVSAGPRSFRLRRVNRIRSIQGAVAIEVNAFSEDQVLVIPGMYAAGDCGCPADRSSKAFGQDPGGRSVDGRGTDEGFADVSPQNTGVDTAKRDYLVRMSDVFRHVHAD